MTGEERIFSGATVEEARMRASEELGATVHEVLITGVDENHEVGVRIRATLAPEAVVNRFLERVIRAGELEMDVRVEAREEVLVGELRGSDLHLFTGGTGRGLDALQYLCNRVLNRCLQNHPPVHLDAEGFKDRRARRLQDEAESAADEAVRTRRAVVLGPYTPAARREIHLALADDPAVETESDGEGFLKRVVIRPRRRR